MTKQRDFAGEPGDAPDRVWLAGSSASNGQDGLPGAAFAQDEAGAFQAEGQAAEDELGAEKDAVEAAAIGAFSMNLDGERARYLLRSAIGRLQANPSLQELIEGRRHSLGLE
jgi:hypothetical protein